MMTHPFYPPTPELVATMTVTDMQCPCGEILTIWEAVQMEYHCAGSLLIRFTTTPGDGMFNYSGNKTTHRDVLVQQGFSHIRCICNTCGKTEDYNTSSVSLNDIVCTDLFCDGYLLKWEEK